MILRYDDEDDFDEEIEEAALEQIIERTEDPTDWKERDLDLLKYRI